MRTWIQVSQLNVKWGLEKNEYQIETHVKE